MSDRSVIHHWLVRSNASVLWLTAIVNDLFFYFFSSLSLSHSRFCAVWSCPRKVHPYTAPNNSHRMGPIWKFVQCLFFFFHGVPVAATAHSLCLGVLFFLAVLVALCWFFSLLATFRDLILTGWPMQTSFLATNFFFPRRFTYKNTAHFFLSFTYLRRSKCLYFWKLTPEFIQATIWNLSVIFLYVWTAPNHVWPETSFQNWVQLFSIMMVTKERYNPTQYSRT